MKKTNKHTASSGLTISNFGLYVKSTIWSQRNGIDPRTWKRKLVYRVITARYRKLTIRHRYISSNKIHYANKGTTWLISVYQIKLNGIHPFERRILKHFIGVESSISMHYHRKHCSTTYKSYCIPMSILPE